MVSMTGWAAEVVAGTREARWRTGRAAAQCSGSAAADQDDQLATGGSARGCNDQGGDGAAGADGRSEGARPGR